MYNNFTFITNGELVPKVGVHQLYNCNLALSSYNNLDQLRILAINAGVQPLFDLISNHTNKIIYDEFASDEYSLVSAISYYNSSVYGIVNKNIATASTKRDDNSLKFSNELEGRVVTLHAMIRLLFNISPPMDTILGHAHNLFTTILYILLINNFNRDYSLLNISDEQKAAIRYACASISAAKHFELSCSLNDVAIPMTAMIFPNIRNTSYFTNNNITTYDAFCTYLREKTNINIDKSTFINKILPQLSNRTLILLECGVDFMIDCLLSKISGTILVPRKLANGLIKPQMYTNIKQKICQSYHQQLSLNLR